MRKILLRYGLFACLLSYTNVCVGQDQPVFSQFPLNPFQFNPSYAAHNGYMEANLFFRKQWLNIENAPTVGAFNFQAPLGRNVSLGLTVISNQTILLTTNSALATFAYRVRLGAYHNLDFGLAGGIGLNNFDLEAIANDPFFSNVEPRNQYVAGQFGFNYRFKNFNLGFALPNLFDSDPNSEKQFQDVNFDPFRNKFGSMGYNFNVGQMQLSPMVIYRSLDNQLDQWEGMVMATYKGFIWLGASYRDSYGVTGIVGIRLKGNYKVSYAYEYPTSDINSATSGSHEFYLGARLGKRDREEEFALAAMKKDSLRQVSKAQKELEEKQKQEKLLAEQQQQKVNEKPVVKPADTTVVIKKDSVETKPVEPPADYYIVLGVYHSQQNALAQIRLLREQGLMPQMHYRVERNYYYIYLVKTSDRKEALDELEKEHARGRFQGVWLYKVPKQ